MAFDFAKAYTDLNELTDEDEGIGLDLMAASESDRIPSEQSPALRFLRGTLRDLQKGEITLEEFLARADRLHRKTLKQAGVFSDSVDPYRKTADADSKELADHLLDALQHILDGCERWFDYGESLDFADAEVGLALIEAGYAGLDEVDEMTAGGDS